MAPVLGKRRRRDRSADVDANNMSTTDHHHANLQALFQQHFESSFEPLPGSLTSPSPAHKTEPEPSDGELASDWNGFSDNGEDYAETVHCDSSGLSKADISREEFKTFMGAKPPSSALRTSSALKRKQPESMENDESSADAANLKKDLALQRLLKESHLLDSHSSLSHSGQNRHKALDLRLQDMGSKTSVFAQQKMPFAQRKGIMAKATKREDLRRREAQENGIILEKAGKPKKKDIPMRQRGIGAPSVGKFRGGMLKINKKDVAAIEGAKKTVRRER